LISKSVNIYYIILVDKCINSCYKAVHMKSIFYPAFVACILTSVPAFAANQSQALLHLSNGHFQVLPPFSNDYLSPESAHKKLAEKSAAFLFDSNEKGTVTGMGANYAILKDGELVTADEMGNASTKTVAMYPAGFLASALGGNFFVEKTTNQIIAIDSDGYFITTGVRENKIRLLGGNFYVDHQGNLVTMQAIALKKNPDGSTAINADGTTTKDPGGLILPTRKIGMGDFSKAIKAGGNYLVNEDGSIITVESTNGYFYGPYHVGTRPEKIGGNYFIGEDHVLYTISNAGVWQKQSPVLGKIKTYGYSYFIADDGFFVFIDGNGTPHTDLIHFKNNEAEVVKKLSGLDTPAASFIPAKQ